MVEVASDFDGVWPSSEFDDPVSDWTTDDGEDETDSDGESVAQV